MYAFIEGTVAEKNPGELVLLAGGVGYSLTCSMATLSAAPSQGEAMRCYTFLSVKEDAMDLFGFATKEEKRMFLSLIGVSGIGPRTALGVLGSMPLKELNLAIVLGDVTTLSRAPGIGKKTAQRIALELKDKLSQADLEIAGPGAAAPLAAGDAVSEALQALLTLGYTQGEARAALQGVKDQADTADGLIKAALRSMV